MENFKEKRTFSFWILLSMLLVYVGMICAINLFAPPSFYDSDMYTDICYGMEMWKHKSIFPEGWVFGNQLYAVSTPVLCGLLYGLIGKPVLAMGLASTIMAALVLWTFDWMIRPVVESREGRMAGTVIFLWAMLFYGNSWRANNGWQLLFTMSSYYAAYAICAFMAFGCYLRREYLHTGKLRAMLLGACFLSYGLGIQSLRQTLVMTMPLMGVEALHILHTILRKQKLDGNTLTITLLLSAANGAGLLTARLRAPSQIWIIGEIQLRPLSGFFGNLRIGILKAMDLVFRNKPLSIALLGMLLLICGISMFGIAYRTARTKSGKSLTLFTLLLFGVLSVLAVEVLTTMKIRSIYYFMLLPLIGFLVANLYAARHLWVRRGLLAFVSAIFVLSLVMELPNVVLPIVDRENDPAYALSDYMLEKGYTTVYAPWNEGANVAIASGGKITAGFWEYHEDPFFYYKFLCNPEVFYEKGDRCIYMIFAQENVDRAIEKAKSKGIEMYILRYDPETDLYLLGASDNLMAAFGS